MLVREVMTSPAVTVSPRTPVKDGLVLLDRHHVTALPVTDREGRLVGVVSEADLLRDLVPRDERVHLTPAPPPPEPPHLIEDVMSTLSLTVAADDDVSDAVELMLTTAVKSLPVVQDGRVVGVVSRSDIVHQLARRDDELRGEVDELLRSAGLDCEVEVVDGEVRIEGAFDPHQRRIADVIARSVAGVVGVHIRG